jgi:hypothetical protein
MTPLGPLDGLGASEHWPDGSLRGVILLKRNTVMLPIGEYTPNYTYDSARSKYAQSLSFHQSGKVKAARFNRQEPVKAPGGQEFMAEKVTFYESGALKRLFPLDGRISAFWTERDEKSLAGKMELSFAFGRMRLFVNSLSFHEEGPIRSVTLWPDDVVTLFTAGKAWAVRNGFSLDLGGRISTLEPSFPVAVPTPLGDLYAYDPFAVGVNADRCSLEFSPDGAVVALKTMAAIVRGDEEPVIEPWSRPHPFDSERRMYHPLGLRFGKDSVLVTRTGMPTPEAIELKYSGRIVVKPFLKPEFGDPPGN